MKRVIYVRAEEYFNGRGEGRNRQQQREAEIAARTQSQDRARLQAIAQKLRGRVEDARRAEDARAK